MQLAEKLSRAASGKASGAAMREANGAASAGAVAWLATAPV